MIMFELMDIMDKRLELIYKGYEAAVACALKYAPEDVKKEFAKNQLSISIEILAQQKRVNELKQEWQG